MKIISCQCTTPMKIRLLTIFFFIVCVSPHAQIKLGIKAGYNLTSLNFSGSQFLPEYTSKSDFNAGLLISIPLFSNCSLQPEVVYSGQGAKNSIIFNPQTIVHIVYDINYLTVPILFKYQHPSGFFVESGPQIGFLLSANFSSGGGSRDNMANTDSPDISWAFGLGYKIPVIPLGFDARYNLGLNSIDMIESNGKTKNSVFQFGIFYLF